MSGIQLPELKAAENLEDGDLILVRKSSMGVDRSLTKAKLVESLGNSAIDGYMVIQTNADKITIKPSNATAVDCYYEGMRISFISPIASNNIVQIKIGSLSYIDLQKYSSEETVKLAKGEYVEAVYTNSIFKQTNNLNTHLVWSNEYTAKAEIAPDATTTTYNLRSAIGVQKPQYYEGMSLLFTVPVTSKGITFVNVDNLGNKKLGESGGSPIAKDVYEDQAIMAIYDGEQFAKQKFSSIHRTPIIVEDAPEHEDIAGVLAQAPEPQLGPEEIDIWAPDYAGDPDDPANTTSPNALDSKGKPIFEKTITVGTFEAMYDSIEKAIAALINDYGEDGGGHKFAIELNNFYVPTEGTLSIYSKSKNDDLRWITIFVKNNVTLKLDSTRFQCNVKYTPIFNFKMSFNRKNCKLAHKLSYAFGVYDNILTFGKNTSITFVTTENAGVIHCTKDGRVEAQYGLNVHTDILFTVGSYLINKATFKYIQIDLPSHCLFGALPQNEKRMYNSTIHTEISPQATHSVLFSTRNDGSCYLQNVTSTDRKHKAIAVSASGKVVLKDCNFSSKTEGSIYSGYDIVVNNEKSVVHLQNTTGNTNQPVNKKTHLGIIHQE